VQRILLAGGGHTHVEVVRRLGAAPPPGCEVVLVSPHHQAPYSGMLPGLVAGHYAHDECHIDLERLCRAARATLVRGEAAGLDLAGSRLDCGAAGRLDFDLLSLNVGSTPDTASVPGSLEHAMPVKPVARFLAAWETVRAGARSAPPHIVVVGGGAGGVELALAMHQRLRADGVTRARLTVVTDTATLLPGHAPGARRILERVLAGHAIATRCGSRVVKVEPAQLHFENGERMPADFIVWATTAAAPAWFAASGLATDARGFVSVDDALRSVSHPRVFAAGDCATMVRHALPKSGVHAVRQGPPLAENLRRALNGDPLLSHRPQRRALALISTGGRHAVASWAGFAFCGRWVWRWKDWIDRRFMARYAGTGGP